MRFSGQDNIFSQAARIKEAQLRDKPERRTWEAAPPFFKWTCGNYIPVREARSLENFQEQLNRAKSFRHHGNDLLAQSKLDDALMQYSHGIAVFLWFQRRDERYVDEVKLLSNLDQLNQPQLKEAREHLAYCFLNAASVLMQQGKFKDAVYSCTKALEFEPDSAKGHFRRAQANYAMDSTHHLELAVKDVKKAAVLNPCDPQVRACHKQWKRELDHQNAKDRSTFKNMFTGEPLYSEEHKGNTLDSPLPEDQGWLTPPFSEAAKRHAADLGIDLDNESVRDHLVKVHRSRQQQQALGTHTQASSPGNAESGPYPETYIQFWQQLLGGKLRWRWHYTFYILLVGNSIWQTAKMLVVYYRFMVKDDAPSLESEF